MKRLALLRTLHRYWKMAQDPRTPAAVRWLIYGGIAYSILPVDVIPDFIPGLGLLDDAAVLPGVIALAMILIPKEVKEAYDAKSDRRAGEKRATGEATPQKPRPIPAKPAPEPEPPAALPRTNEPTN